MMRRSDTAIMMSPTRPTRRPTPIRRGGFTLTELLVAVGVFVVVLVATGKIFSTVNRVAIVSEATSDVLQEIAAVAERVRVDVSNLSPEGVIAIRCVAVPNDYHGERLLNPSLPPEAYIRADQLMFFATGEQRSRTFLADTSGNGRPADQRGEAPIARIYYGHAFQLGEASAGALDESPEDDDGVSNCTQSIDVDPSLTVFPWTDGTVRMVSTIFDSECLGSIYESSFVNSARVPPVDARRWLLARQAVGLMNDDDPDFPPDAPQRSQYLFDIRTAFTIFLNDPLIADPTPQIRDGRVDAASIEMPDVRRRLLFDADGNQLPWRDAVSSARDQYSIISDDLLYYPRGERRAPSMNRVDQALTNHVIGTACGSFAVDWTWDEGVGEAGDFEGVRFTPVSDGPDLGTDRAQPWFGMPDPAVYGGGGGGGGSIQPDLVRGVGAYADADHQSLFGGYYIPAQTILPINQIPNNVESMYTIPAGAGGRPIVVYEAFFGFNRTVALDVDGQPDQALGYTPWPTAIRITAKLHDRNTRLDAGRDLQIVLRLPSRD